MQDSTQRRKGAKTQPLLRLCAFALNPSLVDQSLTPFAFAPTSTCAR